MKTRLATITCLATLACAAPASAQAPALAADRSCYGPGQEVGLAGHGFTPDGPVAISVDGQQLGQTTANPVGEFEISNRAPVIQSKQRKYVFTATDETNPAVSASATVTVSSLKVKVTPTKQVAPEVMRKIVARGFTSGRTLWAHVKRGKGKVRNIKIGRLKGACHTLTAKRRLFRANATPGAYKVQFDTKRRYSKKTRPNTVFDVIVYRYLRASSAGRASAAQIVANWKPLR